MKAEKNIFTRVWFYILSFLNIRNKSVFTFKDAKKFYEDKGLDKVTREGRKSLVQELVNHLESKGVDFTVVAGAEKEIKRHRGFIDKITAEALTRERGIGLEIQAFQARINALEAEKDDVIKRLNDQKELARKKINEAKLPLIDASVIKDLFSFATLKLSIKK
jgi:hypothetical protein